MGPDRVSLKLNAARITGSAMPRPWKPTLIYLVIIYALTFLREKLSERTQAWAEALIKAVGAKVTPPAMDSILLVSQLFILLLTLVAAVMAAGYMWYALKLLRGQRTSVDNVFDGFEYFVKVVVINALIYIFTLLWSLLLFFPGVIASYRYRQAVYILADHPEYGALQCIRESKRMMRGQKLNLFVLDLSFIGWYILCGITAGILLIWKQPYFDVTYAGFYEAVAGIAPRVEAERDNAPRGGDPWER